MKRNNKLKKVTKMKLLRLAQLCSQSASHSDSVQALTTRSMFMTRTPAITNSCLRVGPAESQLQERTPSRERISTLLSWEASSREIFNAILR